MNSVHKIDNEKISDLRLKYRNLEKEYSNKKFEIANQINRNRMTMKQVLKLDAENIIFYFNYNQKIVSNGLKNYSSQVQNTIYEKIYNLDLNIEGAKQDLSDFISWAGYSMFEEKQMRQLLIKLCNSLTIEDTNLFFDLKSLVGICVLPECKDVIEKTEKEIKKRKPVKTESLSL